MKAIKTISISILLIIFSTCANKEKDYDATGVFEATETMVYAQQNGQLLNFDIEEGRFIDQGRIVALIDTTQLVLQIKQLCAGKKVYAAQRPDMDSQIAAMEQQLTKARREQKRYGDLVNDGAAPQKVLDDIKNEVIVLEKELNALKTSLRIRNATVSSQEAATDAQIAVLQDQLKKCYVSVPLSGTVLEKYVEKGEFVTVGKPLFKIAELSHMKLRAYITSAQLEKVQAGQTVTIKTDYGNGKGNTYEGIVEWISAKSEFTPKGIVSDDERADLVYAVKIGVKNDGYIKIGMYAKLKLN